MVLIAFTWFSVMLVVKLMVCFHCDLSSLPILMHQQTGFGLNSSLIGCWGRAASDFSCHRNYNGFLLYLFCACPHLCSDLRMCCIAFFPHQIHCKAFTQQRFKQEFVFASFSLQTAYNNHSPKSTFNKQPVTLRLHKRWFTKAKRRSASTSRGTVLRLFNAMTCGLNQVTTCCGWTE